MWHGVVVSTNGCHSGRPGLRSPPRPGLLSFSFQFEGFHSLLKAEGCICIFSFTINQCLLFIMGLGPYDLLLYEDLIVWLLEKENMSTAINYLHTRGTMSILNWCRGANEWDNKILLNQSIKLLSVWVKLI